MLNPKISVCIPVYNTENVLERCLLSVCRQNFAEKEIIIIDDASPGKDSRRRSAKKIVHSVLKKEKVPFTFICHNQNLGILETRRDAVMAASGEYIFTLDSDDFIEDKNCFSVMYEEAVKNDADILNSRALVYSENPDSITAKITEKKLSVITLGQIEGQEILDDYLIKKQHLGYLWAKLIRRTVFIKALDNIPYTLCTMAEDFIFYFFICLNSKKYFGIENRFYRYSIDSGISSNTKITDIKRWFRVCSAASVFTVIADFINNNPDSGLTEEQIHQVKTICNGFVANNLLQLKQQVIPELQEEAYRYMCEMWGTEYVQIIEAITNR